MSSVSLFLCHYPSTLSSVFVSAGEIVHPLRSIVDTLLRPLETGQNLTTWWHQEPLG